MTQQQQQQQQQRHQQQLRHERRQQEHQDADLVGASCSTQTLAQFVKLAQDYKGWSRSQLARVLGRDATKIVPQSGNPKLDLVTSLARVLEWSIGDVAEMLAGATEDTIPPAQCDGMSPAQVIQAGQAANAQRDFPAAVAYGEWGEVVGEDDERRAAAINIQAIAWDGLGRYEKNIACLRRGLDFDEVSESRRRLLQSNLASAHLVFGNLEEAVALSSLLIQAITQTSPLNLRDHCTVAFSHYVRGSALRRMAQKDVATRCRIEAIASFESCIRLYSEVLGDLSSPTPHSITHICHGAIHECHALLDPECAQGRLDSILSEVQDFEDTAVAECEQWLLAVGWWCVFGCNIAMHLSDESSRSRSLAVLTNKAHEIAELCQDWALWERVLMLEYAHQGDGRGPEGLRSFVVDQEDVRVLVGAAGRFPKFRNTAWRILRDAEFIRGGSDEKR